MKKGIVVENISILVAFGAGLLSFFSPCVLPLAPVYLATLTSSKLYTARTGRIRLSSLLHSLSFVSGFATVFITLGVIAGLTGFAISPNYALLNKIAASLLIAFGSFMLAALRFSWLNYERRLNLSFGEKGGYLRSFLIGGSFSLGWTPCVAPILGSILALASVRATAEQGAYLLAIYSLGLGIPFLVIGVAFDAVTPLLKRLHRYSVLFQVAGGLMLIAVGILMLTNNLSWLSSLPK